MPNNQDMKSGSKGKMGEQSDREFEDQNAKNPSSGKTGQNSQQAGGSQRNIEDDEMTSGGRQGEFSDTSGGKQGQWSPGSSNPST